MNSHLSEILSWALEPLADAMLPKSSEVISNCDVQEMMEAEMELPGWCQCEECLGGDQRQDDPIPPTEGGDEPEERQRAVACRPVT